MITADLGNMDQENFDIHKKDKKYKTSEKKIVLFTDHRLLPCIVVTSNTRAK